MAHSCSFFWNTILNQPGTTWPRRLDSRNHLTTGSSQPMSNWQRGSLPSRQDEHSGEIHAPGWSQYLLETTSLVIVIFVVSLFSRVRPFFPTPWTVTCQALLSMGFPRQEYWSGLLLPSLGDLPDPGITPMFLAPSALAGRFFTNWAMTFLRYSWIDVSSFSVCP